MAAWIRHRIPRPDFGSRGRIHADPKYGLASGNSQIIYPSQVKTGYKRQFLRYIIFLMNKIEMDDGYGSTDLRLYTSTKQKIVNYWFDSLMQKNKIYI
jgi:hypothetical protein